MANQLTLFSRRYFSAMFFTQFFGAFNDNVFKQALILLLTYSVAAKLGMKISSLNNLAALLFILPFFLFSALAGQMADKYEKAKLTRLIKLLEIIIMLIAAVGFIFDIYWLLLVALFLTGTQSTFFGPIKYAYLPAAIPDNELIAANGLIQTSTSLAILIGMMSAGLLITLTNAEYWLAAVTILVAIFGYIAALYIPKTAVHTPDLSIDWNIFRTSWDIIRYLKSLPFLFFVILGNSWFWFLGATYVTQIPEVSKVLLHSDASVVIFLLMLFSVGTATGSLLCKTLTKNQVSLKLLPYGILGLSACTFLLSWALQTLTMPAVEQAYSLVQLMAFNGIYGVFFLLFGLGFFGGLYIVPLYTCMQAYSPSTHRSRIVGANNIFNALFMVISAVFSIAVLAVLHRSLPELFTLTALMNVLFGGLLYAKLKKYQHTVSIQTDHETAIF